VGSGRQWLSWIALDDVLSLTLAALRDTRYDGPVNAVSPQPVRNAEFAQALGACLGRPAVVPAPTFLLRLALGEMADELLLGGQHALPRKALETGHHFLYPALPDALRHVLGTPAP
jgi:NAD dependent epimerase/dehydratase family enzyme